MLREFCAEKLVGVAEALRAGAQRIELCDDLSVGGVSPTDEVIAQAVELVHGLGGTVMVMVRPHGGDFAYSDAELAEMERVIGVARTAGADGIVFGCTRDGALDVWATQRLVACGAGLDMTFHMAFDEIDREAQPQVLSTLAGYGISRVLTHGGSLGVPLAQCLPGLRELVHAAEGRIGIMPGGGITWRNAEHIYDELGVAEVHGTKIVQL